MHQLYVLHEDASGYALFRTTEFEEIANFLPQVQKSVLDISKFRSIVYFVAFQQFESWQEGLENINYIREGLLPQTLQLFLENNVPKSKKSKQQVMLGVEDPVLASEISEKIGVKCLSSETVKEINRGISYHHRKLLKNFLDEDKIKKSRVCLGHCYSRKKLNLTLNKNDSMVTYGLNMVDQLKRNINTLAMRVRKLYDCHFPELFKIVPDPLLYIKCIKEIKNRKALPENINEHLMSILEDEDKVQNILKNAQNSMGMDVSEADIENIEVFIEQILSTVRQQELQTDYVKSKMQVVAPNLSSLMGEMGGARLISEAGSLTHLSRLPASTVQILGAKKTLFRGLKLKENPLKFSSISKSAIIGSDVRIAKSHMSRFLANKCTLAARADYFSAVPSRVFGNNLKLEFEERVKFYEHGKMRLANALEKKTKKKRKNKKLNNLLKESMELDR